VKISFYQSDHQVILGDSAPSETVGFIQLTKFNNNDSLSWQYADGSEIVYADMTTFFTGYYNTWVHFAVIADYSRATIKWYRNGELIQTSNMTGTPIFPSTNREKYLGANGPGSRRIQNGNLDDIRIYNRELSAAEIRALYEGTK
jgi:hypothetical protein